MEPFARYLRAVLGPLSVESSSESWFTAEDTGRYFRLLLDDREVGRAAEPQTLADLLLWSVNQEVSRRTSDKAMVHAGAVAEAGRAVVLAGRSGSGKSTLTAALVAAGFQYLTDEATAIALDDGTVHPYHRPITLKQGSWTLVRGLEAATPDAPSWKIDVWHVDPRALAGGLAQRASPAVVVFPRYQAGVGAVVERVRPPDAAALLALNSLNLVNTGQQGFDRLVTISTEVPCYRLLHSDVDEAVRAIAGLVASC